MLAVPPTLIVAAAVVLGGIVVYVRRARPAAGQRLWSCFAVQGPRARSTDELCHERRARPDLESTWTGPLDIPAFAGEPPLPLQCLQFFVQFPQLLLRQYPLQAFAKVGLWSEDDDSIDQGQSTNHNGYCGSENKRKILSRQLIGQADYYAIEVYLISPPHAVMEKIKMCEEKREEEERDMWQTGSDWLESCSQWERELPSSFVWLYRQCLDMCSATLPGLSEAQALGLERSQERCVASFDHSCFLPSSPGPAVLAVRVTPVMSLADKVSSTSNMTTSTMARPVSLTLAVQCPPYPLTLYRLPPWQSLDEHESIEGMWPGGAKGGCSALSSFVFNPQFCIYLVARCVVTIVVSLTRKSGDLDPISFLLVGTKNERRITELPVNDVLARDDMYYPVLQITKEVSLDPSQYSAVVVVPATQQAGCVGSFVVDVYSTELVALKPL